MGACGERGPLLFRSRKRPGGSWRGAGLEGDCCWLRSAMEGLGSHWMKEDLAFGICFKIGYTFLLKFVTHWILRFIKGLHSSCSWPILSHHSFKHTKSICTFL